MADGGGIRGRRHGFGCLIWTWAVRLARGVWTWHLDLGSTSGSGHLARGIWLVASGSWHLGRGADGERRLDSLDASLGGATLFIVRIGILDPTQPSPMLTRR